MVNRNNLSFCPNVNNKKSLKIELSFNLIRPLFLFKIDCPIIELLGPPRKK